MLLKNQEFKQSLELTDYFLQQKVRSFGHSSLETIKTMIFFGSLLIS